MSVSVVDQLLSQCSPRIMNVSNVGDGSLTKLNLNGLTPDKLLSFKDDSLEFFLYNQALKGGMVGAPQSDLYDLLMGSSIHVDLQKTKTQNTSFVLPYIIYELEDVINTPVFNIISGAAGVGAHAGTWAVTVGLSSAMFNPSLTAIERYFVAGNTLIIHNLSTEGAAQTLVFTIQSAVEVVGQEQAVVTMTPNVTSAYYATLTADQQEVYQPTRGVAIIGANNISDYESYCLNQPQEVSLRNAIFWLQTKRHAFVYDDLALEYLKRIEEGKINPYLKKYKELPISKQNARSFAQYQRHCLNTFFYGQQINEHQTAEDYPNLPRVLTPDTGRFIEFKANQLGVYSMLGQCGRVSDFAGAALDMNFIDEQLLVMRKMREGMTGKRVNEIDAMTDRVTARNIHSVMMGYYKARNRTEFVQDWNPKKIAGGDVNWRYMQYEMIDSEVLFNVIVDDYFIDWKSHFTVDQATRGNQMFILDWRDIKNGIANTENRTAITPDIKTDPNFFCYMKAIKQHVDLYSQTSTGLLMAPANHLIVENFSNACPTLTYQQCDPTPVSL